MKLSKMLIAAIVTFLIANLGLFAQSDAFSIKFSGFVKTDAFYNTRNMVSIREDHITLWPSNKNLDKDGKDLNEIGNFHILSIQTRLAAKIDGPGIFGGRTSGYVETEFLGTTESDINSLRLRHAYVDLIFDNTTIRAGQFWHPLFATENFPDVLNFNTGIPFLPFNRSPQIRLTHKFDEVSVFAAINTQRDFTIDGPDGYSNKYVRNSGIPEASFGINYSTPQFYAGVAASAKTFRPFTYYSVGTDKYINEDKATTISATGNIKVKIDKFQIKAQGNYFQNNPDFLTVGGYGIKSIDNVNHTYEFTPISAVAGWMELMYKDEWEFGIVGGYLQNLGAADDIAPSGSVYGRGLDIEKIIKVYPRIAYNYNKSKIGFETEWASAYYGKKISPLNKKVEDSEAVNSLRFLLAFYLFF